MTFRPRHHLLFLPCWLAAAAGAWAADMDSRRAAVEQTLDRSPLCQGLGSFYWEIGDRRGPLARGSRGSPGGRQIGADTVMPIASASKWVFGAYAAQRYDGRLPPQAVQALQMQAGDDRLQHRSCVRSKTVAECLAQGDNGGRDPAHVGHFSYGGGHAQKLAVALGLGDLDLAALNRDLHRVLPAAAGIDYRSPQPAGGMAASANGYAAFLRGLMGGSLQLGHLLGAEAVCTQPGSCPGAVRSPVPRPWHYSLHHWVEDGPGDDGAFSSAGAFGFYPWISADRQLYGILARQALERAAGVASARCGAALRRAWVSGEVQDGPALQADGTPLAAGPAVEAAPGNGRSRPLLEAWRRRRGGE
ncbi:hypothetical protein [Azospira sp.]|uniref:hypothetical protein n=1 Tax=Azospira sp. TaxID=1872671 RepID=UPI00256499AC|nr:hypothetical protein [Azospira sp.]MDK9689797.1 hypothetical protein [Azospira sp.]